MAAWNVGDGVAGGVHQNRPGALGSVISRRVRRPSSIHRSRRSAYSRQRSASDSLRNAPARLGDPSATPLDRRSARGIRLISVHPRPRSRNCRPWLPLHRLGAGTNWPNARSAPAGQADHHVAGQRRIEEIEQAAGWDLLAWVFGGIGTIVAPILASRVGGGTPPGDVILAHGSGDLAALRRALVEPSQKISQTIPKSPLGQSEMLRPRVELSHPLESHLRNANELGGCFLVQYTLTSYFSRQFYLIEYDGRIGSKHHVASCSRSKTHQNSRVVTERSGVKGVLAMRNCSAERSAPGMTS